MKGFSRSLSCGATWGPHLITSIVSRKVLNSDLNMGWLRSSAGLFIWHWPWARAFIAIVLEDSVVLHPSKQNWEFTFFLDTLHQSIPIACHSWIYIYHLPTVMGYLPAISCPIVKTKRSRLFKGPLLLNRVSDPRETAYCMWGGISISLDPACWHVCFHRRP